MVINEEVRIQVPLPETSKVVVPIYTIAKQFDNIEEQKVNDQAFHNETILINL